MVASSRQVCQLIHFFCLSKEGYGVRQVVSIPWIMMSFQMPFSPGWDGPNVHLSHSYPGGMQWPGERMISEHRVTIPLLEHLHPIHKLRSSDERYLKKKSHHPMKQQWALETIT